MSRYLNSPREADWYACPSCGDQVKVGSKGCLKCQDIGRNKDRNRSRGRHRDDTGPAQTSQPTNEAWPDGVDLPDDAEDFDYEAWKEREFGVAGKLKPHHLPWKYWLGGICLLVALIWLAVFAGYMGR